MSKIKFQGDSGGTGVFTIASPNSSTDRTITLPDAAGTLVDTSLSTTAGLSFVIDEDNLASDLAINTSKKVEKLDENSAQFILQGVLDFYHKKNT